MANVENFQSILTDTSWMLPQVSASSTTEPESTLVDLSRPYIDDFVKIKDHDGEYRVIDLDLSDFDETRFKAISVKKLPGGKKVNKITCFFSQLEIVKRGSRFLRYIEMVKMTQQSFEVSDEDINEFVI